MITASHKKSYVLFYEFFGKALTRLFFRSFDYEFLSEIPAQGAVLMIGNHMSWWDGFWGQRITHEVLRRKYFVMMLENNLRERIGLSKAGTFSIQPNSRSVVESLRYAASLLQSPENAVLIFPTGQIESVYTPTFTFSGGVEKILQYATPATPHIVFYAALIDFEGHPRPRVRVYLQSYTNIKTVADIQDAYNGFYAAAQLRQRQHVLSTHTG